jgi:hypothetical protein
MVRQEGLAFIKAIGTIELSPVLLQKLRKAMAASKKKKKLASTTSTDGAVDEATTALNQFNACKRKAVDFRAPTARMSQTAAAALHSDIFSRKGPKYRAPRAN